MVITPDLCEKGAAGEKRGKEIKSGTGCVHLPFKGTFLWTVAVLSRLGSWEFFVEASFNIIVDRWKFSLMPAEDPDILGGKEGRAYRLGKCHMGEDGQGRGGECLIRQGCFWRGG